MKGKRDFVLKDCNEILKTNELIIRKIESLLWNWNYSCDEIFTGFKKNIKSIDPRVEHFYKLLISEYFDSFGMLPFKYTGS